MYNVLLIIFLIIAIALIVLIMLQNGKDTNLVGSFRTGASGTLFGASGSANFMTRTTAILAALFFTISLLLGNINSNKNNENMKWENLNIKTHVKSTQSTLVTEHKTK